MKLDFSLSLAHGHLPPAPQQRLQTPFPYFHMISLLLVLNLVLLSYIAVPLVRMHARILRMFHHQPPLISSSGAHAFC